MEVEDTCERVVLSVSIVKICVRTGSLLSELFELHSRGCKESGDHIENICLALRGVIESWRINQYDTTAIQIKGIRELYGVCTGS